MNKKDKLKLSLELLLKMKDFSNPNEWQKAWITFLYINKFGTYLKSILYCEISKRRKITKEYREYYLREGIREILSTLQYEIINFKIEEDKCEFKDIVIRMMGKITRHWIYQNIPNHPMESLNDHDKVGENISKKQIREDWNIISKKIDYNNITQKYVDFIDNKIIKKQIYKKILLYLARRLDSQEWDIFKRFIKYNEKHREIAEELNIPIHKVHDTFRKIKRTMKKSYFYGEIHD